MYYIKTLSLYCTVYHFIHHAVSSTLSRDFLLYGAEGNLPLFRPLFVQMGKLKKTQKSNSKVQHWKLIISLILPPSLRFLSSQPQTFSWVYKLPATINLGPSAVNTGLRTCTHTQKLCTFVTHSIDPHCPQKWAWCNSQFRAHFSQFKRSASTDSLRLKQKVEKRSFCFLFFRNRRKTASAANGKIEIRIKMTKQVGEVMFHLNHLE